MSGQLMSLSSCKIFVFHHSLSELKGYNNMFSYLRSKQNFINDFETGRLISLLYKSVSETNWNSTVDESELASWRNSLAYMTLVLKDEAVPKDLHIGLEYFVERGYAGRVDMMIGGYASDGSMHIAVIELKQWSNTERSADNPSKILIKLNQKSDTIYHDDDPVEQVRGYCQRIRDTNTSVSSGAVELHPIVFLHNLSRKKDLAEIGLDPDMDVRVFYEGDIPSFREYLAETFTDGHAAINVFRKFKAGTPPICLDDLVSLSDTSAWTTNGWNPALKKLRPDQGYYFNTIKTHIDAGEKKNIIIYGNPGSGKTLLAMLFLGYCKHIGKKAVLLYRGGAPHKAFAEAGMDMDKDCRYINEYMNDPETYDVMIMDEAHRCDLSQDRFKDLLDKAGIAIFLADKHQRIHPDDNGVKLLEKYEADADVYFLTSQLRCNMDDGYIAWIDQILQIEYPDRDPDYSAFRITLNDLDFRVKILETPEEAMILAKDREILVLSGACNPHKVPMNGILESLEWFRAANDTSLSFVKHHYNDTNQINYAGKIFDIHGLEHDKVLVIIGPDMYLDDSGNVAVNRSMIGSFKANSSIPDKEVTQLIKNTYRVLLTRGMEECSIYCCDDRLREYFLNQV